MNFILVVGKYYMLHSKFEELTCLEDFFASRCIYLTPTEKFFCLST